MAAQDRLSRLAQKHHLVTTDGESVPVLSHAAILVMSVYGAYFGAGLGILLLAMLTILVPDDLQNSNALKGLLSLLINAVAVVYFAAFGPVRWGPMAVMAVGALGGGYLGAGLARRLGRNGLRIAVVSYGVVVAIVLLLT
jgi:uncharacterized membrane protein YfcA